jgi:hypothetical protein
MPAHLAELFLADLEQRAGEWKEAMRKARVEEIKRAAELKAASGEARRQWEATADGWTRTYLALRDDGKGHREALHWIRGPKERTEHPQLGTIELGVKEGLARRKTKARAERDAAVCRLAKAGKTRPEISDALRLDYQRVTTILAKAGIVPAKGDRAAGVRKTMLGSVSGGTGGPGPQPNLKEAVMPGAERSYCVFAVQYTRQIGTNRWKAETNEKPGMTALNAEGIMSFVTAGWGEQREVDTNHATILVSIERDLRFFPLSPELEEGRIAMTEKANQVADRELTKRHPDAEIERGE